MIKYCEMLQSINLHSIVIEEYLLKSKILKALKTRSSFEQNATE